MKKDNGFILQKRQFIRVCDYLLLFALIIVLSVPI